MMLIDPPLEAHRKAAAAEAWIAELDSWLVEYADERENVEAIQRERALTVAILAQLREFGDDDSKDDWDAIAATIEEEDD